MSGLTEGCTLISWLASLFGLRLREHGCCQEHDLFYEQGGSWKTKVWVDFLLSKCVFLKNTRDGVGALPALGKAVLGFLIVSLNPYAHIVWHTEFLED